MSDQKVHVVMGATGTGKTALALKIAQKENGELINVDSRQIYKYLDIGTNKGNLRPAPDLPGWNYPRFYVEDTDIPINLVSFLEPDQPFDAFSFRDLVYKLVQILQAQGKTPILVGGSGLYLQTILQPNQYAEAETANLELRAELDKKSVAELQVMLPTEVLNSMNNSDANNPRRLIRAIEKAQDSSQDTSPASDARKYPTLDFEKHYLEFYIENLEPKLTQRAEKMVADGIVSEVEQVLDMGYPESSIALQGISYREVLSYLHGELPLEQLAEKIYISHRQYAKKQMTWFRKYTV